MPRPIPIFRSVFPVRRYQGADVFVETKVEIQTASRRLLPSLANAFLVVSICLLVASCFMLASMLFLVAQEDEVVGVTESGDVFHLIPKASK